MSQYELVTYAKELERKLESMATKCDRLERQLDQYSEEQQGFTWDSTSLLQERASNAEMQLHELKKSMRQLEEERNSLREDNDALSGAKRLADKTSREVSASLGHAKQEVEFYQNQAVGALQARDRAVGEAEQLRNQMSKLEAGWSKHEQELRAEKSSNAELRQRIGTLEQEAAALGERAEQATLVPQLRLEISERNDALSQEIRARKTAEAKLRKQEQAVEAEQRKTQAAQASLDKSLSGVKERDAAVKAAEQRASELQALQEQTLKDLEEARAKVKQQEEELVAARTAADELTASMQQVADEKMKLLVDNASLREQLREQGTVERDDGGAFGGWPWQTSPPK